MDMIVLVVIIKVCTTAAPAAKHGGVWRRVSVRVAIEH
jgi:hypothetical protein